MKRFIAINAVELLWQKADEEDLCACSACVVETVIDALGLQV